MMHGQRNIKSVYMFFLPERTSWRKLGTFHTAMLFWKFRRTAYKFQRQSHPCSDLLVLQTLRVPGGWGSQISRQSAHEGGKVVRPTYRPPLPPRKYSWYSFVKRLSHRKGHSAGRKDLSKKNSNDIIGNRTCNLSACSGASTDSATAFPSIRLTLMQYKHADIKWQTTVGR